MTQEQRVLEHLQSGRRLTALNALKQYGIIQLPARIYRLRKAGHPIQKEMVTVHNRYNETIHCASYYLTK